MHKALWSAHRVFSWVAPRLDSLHGAKIRAVRRNQFSYGVFVWFYIAEVQAVGKLLIEVCRRSAVVRRLAQQNSNHYTGLLSQNSALWHKHTRNVFIFSVISLITVISYSIKSMLTAVGGFGAGHDPLCSQLCGSLW